MLQDLSPLENIQSIGGSSLLGSGLYILNNDILQSLTGLENLAAASILDLNIYNNPQLSECDVSSICDYLVDPNGTVDIHDNASGCNSLEEVQLACDTTVIVQELNALCGFTLFPNPCAGTIRVSISNKEQGTTILEVLTISGIRIKELLNEEMSPGTHEMQVDLRDLPVGVYYCVLTTKDGIQTTKVIKL